MFASLGFKSPFTSIGSLLNIATCPFERGATVFGKAAARSLSSSDGPTTSRSLSLKAGATDARPGLTPSSSRTEQQRVRRRLPVVCSRFSPSPRRPRGPPVVLGLPRPTGRGAPRPRTVGSRHARAAASPALVRLAPLTARPSGADRIHPSYGDSLLTLVSAEPLLAPTTGVRAVPERDGLLPGPRPTSAFGSQGRNLHPIAPRPRPAWTTWTGRLRGRTESRRPVTGRRCEPAARMSCCRRSGGTTGSVPSGLVPHTPFALPARGPPAVVPTLCEAGRGTEAVSP